MSSKPEAKPAPEPEQPADWTQKVWKPGRHHNGVPDKLGEIWCPACGWAPEKGDKRRQCPKCNGTLGRISFP
jgi:hypothetical protein